MPDNLNDMHNLNIEAVNSFSKLDPNIQVLFDNDYTKFAQAVEDGSYVSIINEAILKKNNTSQKEEESEK